MNAGINLQHLTTEKEKRWSGNEQQPEIKAFIKNCPVTRQSQSVQVLQYSHRKQHQRTGTSGEPGFFKGAIHKPINQPKQHNRQQRKTNGPLRNQMQQALQPLIIRIRYRKMFYRVYPWAADWLRTAPYPFALQRDGSKRPASHQIKRNHFSPPQRLSFFQPGDCAEYIRDLRDS